MCTECGERVHVWTDVVSASPGELCTSAGVAWRTISAFEAATNSGISRICCVRSRPPCVAEDVVVPRGLLWRLSLSDSLRLLSWLDSFIRSALTGHAGRQQHQRRERVHHRSSVFTSEPRRRSRQRRVGEARFEKSFDQWRLSLRRPTAVMTGRKVSVGP